MNKKKTSNTKSKDKKKTQKKYSYCNICEADLGETMKTGVTICDDCLKEFEKKIKT